jgi:hypothetical protein
METFSMLKKNIVLAGLCIAIFLTTSAYSQTLEQNFNDLVHYLKISNFDLAQGYAQSIVDSNAAPVDIFKLADANPQGYNLIVKARENTNDAALAEACGKVLDLIEQGRFIRRSDPKVITEEIARLSTTSRGRLTATKRLQDAGEYAVPFMLDALADQSRKAEWPDISQALAQMSRQAIRPLVAALQSDNIAVKSEIIKALGKLGYPQSLPYLKYVVEKDASAELMALAQESIRKIDPAALNTSAAQLFYRLADDYYYHAESLAPAEDVNFANMWFWDAQKNLLIREQVDSRYFNELMSMRCCEWSLKADPGFGQSIGLWIAAFFKAESYEPQMPAYFGQNHPDAFVYATTAGAEYLQQALARAIKDRDSQVALGVIEALVVTAGPKTIFYSVGSTQPIIDALSFNNKAVKYSAAIAIASAGPIGAFSQSQMAVLNLADAISETGDEATPGLSATGETSPAGGSNWNAALADSYALRAAQAMLKVAQTRNSALDLSIAEKTLITATKDKRADIQMLSGQILAYLTTPGSQRAIAAMALSDTNSKEIRVAAFNSLAVSAKQNGSLLDDATIDAIYTLISAGDTDPLLRSAASSAFGALNLPSQKVKSLILDQAKT